MFRGRNEVSQQIVFVAFVLHSLYSQAATGAMILEAIHLLRSALRKWFISLLQVWECRTSGAVFGLEVAAILANGLGLGHSVVPTRSFAFARGVMVLNCRNLSLLLQI